MLFFWRPKLYQKSIKIENRSHFYNTRSIFKPWVTYFCKIFDKLKNIALEHQKLRKKKSALKHPMIKKEKNRLKCKIRKLEPQPEQM